MKPERVVIAFDEFEKSGHSFNYNRVVAKTQVIREALGAIGTIPWFRDKRLSTAKSQIFQEIT